MEPGPSRNENSASGRKKEGQFERGTHSVVTQENPEKKPGEVQKIRRGPSQFAKFVKKVRERAQNPTLYDQEEALRREKMIGKKDVSPYCTNTFELDGFCNCRSNYVGGPQIPIEDFEERKRTEELMNETEGEKVPSRGESEAALCASVYQASVPVEEAASVNKGITKKTEEREAASDRPASAEETASTNDQSSSTEPANVTTENQEAIPENTSANVETIPVETFLANEEYMRALALEVVAAEEPGTRPPNWPPAAWCIMPHNEKRTQTTWSGCGLFHMVKTNGDGMIYHTFAEEANKSVKYNKGGTPSRDEETQTGRSGSEDEKTEAACSCRGTAGEEQNKKDDNNEEKNEDKNEGNEENKEDTDEESQDEASGGNEKINDEVRRLSDVVLCLVSRNARSRKLRTEIRKKLQAIRTDPNIPKALVATHFEKAMRSIDPPTTGGKDRDSDVSDPDDSDEDDTPYNMDGSEPPRTIARFNWPNSLLTTTSMTIANALEKIDCPCQQTARRCWPKEDFDEDRRIRVVKSERDGEQVFEFQIPYNRILGSMSLKINRSPERTAFQISGTLKDRTGEDLTAENTWWHLLTEKLSKYTREPYSNPEPEPDTRSDKVKKSQAMVAHALLEFAASTGKSSSGFSGESSENEARPDSENSISSDGSWEAINKDDVVV